MPDPQQFATPLQVVNGTFLTRPQGSSLELADRVNVLCHTPPGWLDGPPADRKSFGLADQRFRRGGADLDEVSRQIQAHVPDAEDAIEEDPSRIDAGLDFLGIQVASR